MTVFAIALVIGVVYAIVGFIFSMVAGGRSSGGSCDAPVCDVTGEPISGGSADCGTVTADGGRLAFISLAPNMIALALIGFGLSGEILTRQTDIGLWAALVPAAIIGYGLMFFVNNYIYMPLQRADNTAKNARSLIGATVEVTENIRGAGFGSVRGRTSKGSGVFIYSAKSHDGGDILAGEQATVLSVENGCMTVEKINLN